MKQFGIILIALGALLLAGGVLLVLLGHIPFIGRLPGDIRFGGRNWGVYAPITTCILLSILLTIILNIVLRFFR